MRWSMCGWTLVAVAAAMVGTALAQDKGPTIKEIMAKLNKPGGIYPTMAKELKADDTDWDDVQQQAKTFAKMAAALGKNAPPKGEKKSWDDLAKSYAENARALEAAAAKKDKKAVLAAHGKLGGGACDTCHKAHRMK